MSCRALGSFSFQRQLLTSLPILLQSPSQDVKPRHSPAHIHSFSTNSLPAGALVFRSSNLETDSSATNPTTPFKSSSKASASGGGHADAAPSPHTPSPKAASANSTPHSKSGGKHSAFGSKSKTRNAGGAVRHHHKGRSPSPPKQCDSNTPNRIFDN